MFINREMETLRGWHYAVDFQSCNNQVIAGIAIIFRFGC